MKINNKKQSFTLIELSVVLLVMGLLTTGFLAARKIISSATAQKVLSTVNRIDKAYALFYDAYGALPGQMQNDASCVSEGFASLSPSETAVCTISNVGTADTTQSFNGVASMGRINFISSSTSSPKLMLNRNIVASGGALALTGFLNKEDVRYPKFHTYSFSEGKAPSDPSASSTYLTMYNQGILSGIDDNVVFMPSSWAPRSIGSPAMNAAISFKAPEFNTTSVFFNADANIKSFLYKNSNTSLPKNAITLAEIRPSDALCPDIGGYYCNLLQGAVTIEVAKTISAKIADGTPMNNKMLAVKPYSNADATVCTNVINDKDFVYGTNNFATSNTTDRRKGCALIFFVADI